MELSIDHESRAIILWLSSNRTVNVEPLILKGKELKYRVVVIRSGFGDLFSDTSALLWFNRTSCHANHSHGCALAAALHCRKGHGYNETIHSGKEAASWKQGLKDRTA